MKKLIYIVLIVLPGLAAAQVRTGVNTQTPTTTLHVKPSGTEDPLKVEGIKAGSGLFLVLDNNGVVKTSTDKSNLAFVLPAISNTTGLALTRTSQTGSVNYTENSAPANSIPTGGVAGSGSWTKIPDMESSFNIAVAANTLSITAEGMVQYNGTLALGSAVSYALGIFLDGKLIATRTFILASDGFAGSSNRWSILGQASNLSVGAHKIELYATRRNTVGTGPEDLAIAQPAASSTLLNQFMAKAVLQINGVYN
ncbi:hypothetical protein [Pedobacter sp. ASV12]|uniref:hypothetical protein n=1 Tax=Pedobacter sp. ASV12 TaxID=2795120 RepID=UPI0018EBC40E|nr:hypothetical protein [Pedobacter sp. ASV12]